MNKLRTNTLTRSKLLLRVVCMSVGQMHSSQCIDDRRRCGWRWQCIHIQTWYIHICISILYIYCDERRECCAMLSFNCPYKSSVKRTINLNLKTKVTRKTTHRHLHTHTCIDRMDSEPCVIMCVYCIKMQSVLVKSIVFMNVKHLRIFGSDNRTHTLIHRMYLSHHLHKLWRSID